MMKNPTPFAAAACALAVLGAVPAGAQTVPPVPAVPPQTNTTRAFTDAPTPNRGVPEIAPSDRAGTRTSQDAGPLDSTPFSSLPSSRSGGSSMSPADRDTGSRPGDVPNLSK